MITDNEIKRIIGIKYPEVMQDTDMIEVIKRFIMDKKGIDVGEIERPGSNLANSFVATAIRKGVHPFSAMSKGNEIFCMEFMFQSAHLHYINKFNESL